MPVMLLIHTLFLLAAPIPAVVVNAIACPRLRRRFKSPNDRSQRNVKLDVISRLRHREKMSRQRFENPNGALRNKVWMETRGTKRREKLSSDIRIVRSNRSVSSLRL